MQHDSSIIATIVVGLVLAFAGGLAALKLRLPPIVGYLLAGVAIGPFSPGFVGDEALASQLAEIGIILLMFGVGLHFSVRDLLSVRTIAIPGALVQIGVATILGAGLGHLWGWSWGAGFVFGLALSVASTVVLLRALEERQMLHSINGRIAVGWLVVEDLAMVLVLVLLPAMTDVLGGDPEGLGQAGAGGLWATLAVTLGKAALFLALMLVVGKRLVPWLLVQVARTGSRELFTLSVLATALGIAYGSAALFGVSFALGAFFAGVVLAETDFSHQAAADSLPLKDAFAVLFFVSVGMLFDPAILMREPLAVLAVLLVILAGKSLAAFGIVLAFGYPVSTAFIVSASLAQIGEFSFILAGLGTTLEILPPEASDLILAGAILSITLNPMVFAALGRLAAWIDERPRVAARLQRHGSDGHLSSLPAEGHGEEPHDHAVIVGYGGVGSVIGQGLMSQGLPVVVIEQDRRRAERLRAQGIAAIYGDASTPGILKAAHLTQARLLVIATPEGIRTRRIIELARQLKPDIDTAVRTQSEAEVAHLEQQGVGVAIMGERELAFGLMDYALRSLGTSDEEARRVVQDVRTSGEGAAFERRAEAELARHAPELRRHTE